jgi:sugar lactone lactonase YvrE
MSTSNATVLCEARCQVGESPIWHAAEQALYWVDIEGRAVHRVDAAGQHRQWAVAERIGCIAVHAQGGLLAAMETGLFQLTQQADGTLAAARVQAVEFPLPDMRFNDGRTDREGRFWVTSMVRNMAAASPAGALFRYAQGQFTATSVTGLRTGNGLGFSPDGRVMYLSDSHPTAQKIWAFDLDSDGQPTGQRLFVDMQQHPGRPDGAAVDADGCYWICGNDAGLVHRFTPDGRLDRSLAIPAAKPAMCAFGGAGLDTLFVTSIRPGGDIDLSDQPLAGSVFALRPGVRGLPEPAFV